MCTEGARYQSWGPVKLSSAFLEEKEQSFCLFDSPVAEQNSVPEISVVIITGAKAIMLLWPDVSRLTPEHTQRMHSQCGKDMQIAAKMFRKYPVKCSGKQKNILSPLACARFSCYLVQWLMPPIASDCLELITLIMYKHILSERISKSFSGTSFRGNTWQEVQSYLKQRNCRGFIDSNR